MITNTNFFKKNNQLFIYVPVITRLLRLVVRLQCELKMPSVLVNTVLLVHMDPCQEYN